MRKTGSGKITKVGDLFEKYRMRLSAPQGVVIDAARDVIKDLLHVELSKSQCTYRPAQKILMVTASGMVKSEIMLRKQEILTHIRGRLAGKSFPVDIL